MTLSDPVVGVDYETADEDDTTAAEPDNTVKFTVTADDRTRTETYSFEVAITTNKAKANLDNEKVTYEDGDDDDVLPDHYVVTVEVSARQDDRGKVVADLKNFIIGADDEDTLTYKIVSAKAEIDIGTTPGDSELILNYVPDPDDVLYGADDVLSYTGDNAVVVTIDDGYNTAANPAILDEDGDPVVPARYEPDLTLTLNITVNVQQPPPQLYPVAEVDVDENLTNVVVLAADNAKLAEIIGDAIGDVKVTHAGGSGAGAIGADNFMVAPDTGAVTLTKVSGLNYEVDGPQHTLTLSVLRVSDDVQLGSVTVVLTVNDVNEAPSITTSDASAFISEDAQKDDVVQTGDRESDGDYQLAATDPEDDGITFRIDGKTSPFAISSDNKLVVRANDLFDYNLATVVRHRDNSE